MTLFRHGNRYLSADDGREIVESKERRLTAGLMLRWNGTIAQDQDQPVFKKSSPGRSLSTKGSSRASEQNRFAIRRVHIMLSGGDSSHKLGRQDVQYLSAHTGPPADIRYPLSSKAIQGEACCLSASVEPTHALALESTDPLSGSGISSVRGLGISLPIHGIDSRIGCRTFEGNSRGAARKRALGVPTAPP